MSMDTIERPPQQHVGDDDGSGNIADWERWTKELDQRPERLQGGRAYVTRDVGRRAILGNRRSAAGISPEFRTDRIMPAYPRLTHQLGGIVVSPPEASAS